MNAKKHWDDIAPSYNAEIFDVFNSDRKKILNKYFNKYANKKHSAIDFGCGNGKAFPYLAPRFKTIIGVDISQGLLNQAKELPYKNIVLKQADLTRSARLPQTDFIFCCNVAILSTVEGNLALLKNISKALKNSGSALIVIPSLESMIFSAWRMIDWYQKEKVKPEKIDRSEFSGFTNAQTDILQGLVSIDGVTTKHYTSQEIEIIFPRCGLQVSVVDKIEYDWSSEFASPPRWMTEPYPWDWLVSCSKLSS
ncbi:MAG: class I SAM-dependent methyltransferase [Bacteroidetes bacterium]|nr:class I SAM-dependent methyltransferase [Bacteroidota bacterium]